MANTETTSYQPPVWTPKLVKVADLQENPKNPKIISDLGRRRLRKSLDKFGLAGTTVANADLMIIDGHSRKAELISRGIEEVWVSLPDRMLTKRDYDEMNAIFDVAKAGEPDLLLMEETLGAEFFDDWDLNSGRKPTANQDDYEIPAEIVTMIVPGDVIEIGPHRLVCGDSTDAKAVEKLLQGKEPYLMVTDPPYGVEYDPTWRHKAGINNSSRQGKVQNDDRADWREAWRLSPARVAYVWHGGKHGASVQESLEVCDFDIRAQIIWNKNQMVFSRGDYHWKHEPCLYAVRKGNAGNWAGDRKQTTVWDIQSILQSSKHKAEDTAVFHGTQKPVECMARPLANHDGDVYDPFLGSGTTMVAAHQLGRRCFGMELDPKYCQIIVDRMRHLIPDIEVKINGNGV